MPKLNSTQRAGTLFACTAILVCVCGTSTVNGQERDPADPPSYLPWYTASPSPPSPLPSAFVSVGGAWGAANVYNTHQSAIGPTQAPGTGMLSTGQCLFLCFGAPGVASHHFVDYGNDVDPGGTFPNSDTHFGSPDDCARICPGGVPNNAFSVTVDLSPSPPAGEFFVVVDGTGNFAVPGNVVSAGSVVAGAGVGLAAPSASPGSLVSHTGLGKGSILFGNSSSFVSCDYGTTSAGVLTCDSAFALMPGSQSGGFSITGTAWAMGGVQPNSSSGGYAPEVFPEGSPTPNAQILSGSCTIIGSGVCAFPNSFTFPNTSYNCAITAQGTTPTSYAYAKATTSITIHASALVTRTFSYICTG